ncbi:MAG: hypothetical protein J0L94_05120 [Rhodothermia bacterium]|nr:hypothetical protein [Rhodothermia bacterium]
MGWDYKASRNITQERGEATPTGLGCVFDDEFLPRGHPDGALPYVMK